MELIVPIQKLDELACSVEVYRSSPRFVEEIGLVYPDGFTTDEAMRLLRENPTHLIWLSFHRLIQHHIYDVKQWVKDAERLKRRGESIDILAEKIDGGEEK